MRQSCCVLNSSVVTVPDAALLVAKVKITTPDRVPQTKFETPHIDDLLFALATVNGDHVITRRDEGQTFGLIEVR